MLNSFTGNSFLVLAVLVFVAVLLMLEGLYLLWKSYKGPEASRMNQRLRALAASRDRTAHAKVLKERMLSELPLLQRLLQAVPRAHGLDRYILQSGLQWTVSRLLVFTAASGVAGCAATMALAHQPLLTGLMAGVLLSAVPSLYVNYRRSRRLGRIERQLPDAMDLITRALRAGHAFSSSLKMAGEEMPEPIAGEFRIVHDEVNFGVALPQALTNLSDRVPLTDLRYFVVAVIIQRDSGGNLTEILANLSRLIRERLKLFARVKILSSEGRMSAWILGLMPFALAGVMNLVNPEFMSPLWKDPIGITIVQYMLTLMVIGALILRSIIRIRV